MKTSRCLIFSQDLTQLSLLPLTLREYGIRFRFVEKFEMLGPLSTGVPTLAWFIDLDGVQQSVTQVTAMARRIVPDARIVFLSSRFSAEVAQECVQEHAAALLVKPVQIQRLVQCISSFQQEPELLDQDGLIPDSGEPDAVEDPSQNPAAEALIQRTRFTCPICANRFETGHFKQWKFHVSETESDFCPVYPKKVFPELYLICACPKCLFATMVGRFGRCSPMEKDRELFLEGSQIQRRRDLAGDCDLTGERTFQEGWKSFELAETVAMELRFGEWDTFFGELLLKSSWFCRRMGKKKLEEEAQKKAMQHYIRMFRPYVRRDGFFRRKAAILASLAKGETLLPDRTIILAGFLAAELSRRLGLSDQARFYYSEVLQIPFLSNYSFLHQHIQKAHQLLEDPQGAEGTRFSGGE
jgi:CheY-like chemotaxis protein